LLNDVTPQTPEALTKPRRSLSRPPRLGLQICIAAGLLAVLIWLGLNMVANVGRLGGTFGFSFLTRPAGFEIGESLLAYSASDSYLRAILVGLINTIQLALVGAAGSLVAGFIIAMLRVTGLRPVALMLDAYVEAVRNTPLLLQLFIWSTLVKALPPVRQVFEPVPGLIISNRGLYFPVAQQGWTYGLYAVALLLFVLAVRSFLSAGAGARLRRYQIYIAAGSLAFLLSLLQPLDFPALSGFNVRGGGSLSSEFLCMAIGIIFYHSALVAEIVRAGFNSVPKGQYEAGRALGLPPLVIFGRVIIPQALRLIILPTTSLFQGLAKSTSLAVAIGFPELLTVVNTVTGQTGQPIETAAILVLSYFCLSFVIAQIGNSLNGLVRIKER
jgi:general L-amino acid transport system permease protein